MKGRRLSDGGHVLNSDPGDYWWNPNAGGEGRPGHWECHCPVAGLLVGNLAAHDVTEHEDGTITVSPSILVSDGSGGHRYHGFLTAGEWRDA